MALFNRQHLKVVVLIENQVGKSKFRSIATGFLVGFILDNNPDPQKRTYRIFLVTNRHVFEGAEVLWLRFDKKENSGTARFPIYLKQNNETKWLAHKNTKVDLAMLTISHQFLNDQGVDWLFFNEEMIAYQKDFEDIGIELGDELFILGFPMGLSGSLQNFAIVRSGTIARVDEEIVKREKYFLIDSTIFPGNSGGPVLLKPELASLTNTKAVNSVYVLGVVSGYKLYKEPLYSHQSNPPSVGAVSIENSGLAVIVPMDFAKEIYQDFIKQQKKLEKEIKGKEKTIQEKVDASQK